MGIVGSGVDLSHPDFVGARISAFSLVGTDVLDLIGHETPVVWIINRIAPNAELVVVKDRTALPGDMHLIIDACERLRSMGVRLINLSMATFLGSDATDPLSREVDFLARTGVTVVAPAGNNGPRRRTIGCPGAADGALTVGKTNDRDEVSRESSRGPTIDGRIKPDCVAPGVHIPAAVPLALGAGPYRLFECTSASTPHVTGILALLLQERPDASPALLKRAIMSTCDPIGGRVVLAGTGTDIAKRLKASLGGDIRLACGAGRVNGYRAYQWLRAWER